MRRSAAVLAVLSVLSGCAGTRGAVVPADAPGARAEEAYRRGEFAKAAALARPGAETGDPRSLCVAGLLEFYGDGVPEARKDALVKAERSAAAGDHCGLVFMGWVHQSGVGAPKDDARAAGYYSRARPRLEAAAAAGDLRAQYALAQFLAAGYPGIGRDFPESLRRMRLAAAGGYGEAETTLGEWLREGYGVDRDTRAADALLASGAAHTRGAAVMGDLEAMADYGALLLAGDGVERDEKEALEWLRRSADKDFARAQSLLGERLVYGERSSAEERAAGVKLMKRSADQGDPLGFFMLGAAYRDGKGVEKDAKRAAGFFDRAADQGLTLALRARADLCETETDTCASETEALGWRLRAAEHGDAEAMWDVSEMYRRGLGAAADLRERARWLERGAALGSTKAAHNLAIAYLRAEGVAKDGSAAVRWFGKCVAADEQPAMSWLATMYEDGDGVKRDPAAAAAMYRTMLAWQRRHPGGDPKFEAHLTLQWLEHAARLGDAAAAEELCRSFRAGEVVEGDRERAAKWCPRGAPR